MSYVEQPSADPQEARSDDGDAGFLSSNPPRRRPESALVRIVATAGVVGIGTALGAALGAADVDPWTIGLVVALLSVVLAAILWRSRML
jgi:hypothetical protein